MVNFHNYGDFQGVLVRKNYGEFTMDIMVNFALNKLHTLRLNNSIHRSISMLPINGVETMETFR